MKKETKDDIVFAGSMVLTMGTSAMLGLMAGWGATALVNVVFPDGLTKGQLKLFGAIVGVGSGGVTLAACDALYPKFTGYLQDVMDIFPTDKEAKDAN